MSFLLKFSIPLMIASLVLFLGLMYYLYGWIFTLGLILFFVVVSVGSKLKSRSHVWSVRVDNAIALCGLGLLLGIVFLSCTKTGSEECSSNEARFGQC